MHLRAPARRTAWEASIRHLFRGTRSATAIARERQQAVDALPDPAGHSPELDQIAAAAATLCGAGAGLVTLIDGDAMLTPGRFNARLRNVSPAETVCGHAIHNPDEVLCVPDLLLEQRFAQLPVARGPEAIRFYAGAPLRSADGHALGMLCAFDPDPKGEITDDQRRALSRLARLAVQRLIAMPSAR